MIARQLVDFIFETPPGKLIRKGVEKASDVTFDVTTSAVKKSWRYAKGIAQDMHKKSDPPEKSDE